MQWHIKDSQLKLKDSITVLLMYLARQKTLALTVHGSWQTREPDEQQCWVVSALCLDVVFCLMLTEWYYHIGIFSTVDRKEGLYCSTDWSARWLDATHQIWTRYDSAVVPNAQTMTCYPPYAKYYYISSGQCLSLLYCFRRKKSNLKHIPGQLLLIDGSNPQSVHNGVLQ